MSRQEIMQKLYQDFRQANEAEKDHLFIEAMKRISSDLTLAEFFLSENQKAAA